MDAGDPTAGRARTDKGRTVAQRHVLVVLTDPVAGREDEYNEWYDTVHLREVLTVPGFVAAQRFAMAEGLPGSPTPPQRYVAFYELETDDLPGAVAALTGSVGSMTMTSALDRATVGSYAVTAIGARVTAEVADRA
jgi:hypothetical protein